MFSSPPACLGTDSLVVVVEWSICEVFLSLTARLPTLRQCSPAGYSTLRLVLSCVCVRARVQFLESFLNENQRLRLAVRMKGLFRAIMGNPTGFYTLDLASTQGRLTAIKVGQRDVPLHPPLFLPRFVPLRTPPWNSSGPLAVAAAAKQHVGPRGGAHARPASVESRDGIDPASVRLAARPEIVCGCPSTNCGWMGKRRLIVSGWANSLVTDRKHFCNPG